MCKFKQIFFSNCVVLLLISPTYSEIVTVQDTTKIYCIEDDNDDDNDSTLFISPPLEKLQSNSDLLKDVVWDNDDWTLKTSTEIPFALVTDKRWEEFQLNKTDYHQFNFSGSKSVSVLSPVIVEIYAYNNETAGIYKMFDLNESAKWYHFSVISRNNRLLLYENDKIVKNETDFGVTEVVFRSRTPTYWKIHEYDFKWSNTVTKNDPTAVKIPATGKSCLFLYTSLCSDCILKIIINNETKTIHSEYKNSSEIENYWKTNKIKIEPDRKNEISIYKEHHGSGNGYWAIDIGICDSHNIASYRVPSELTKSNYTCNTLSDHHQEHSNNLTNKVRSLCETGKFNDKNRFSCNEVFGPKHPLCENHLFCSCLNISMGFGVWRRFSLECYEQCKDGTWGFDCNEKCEEGCAVCDRNNGKCSEILLKGWSIMWSLVVSIITILCFFIFIILFIWYKYCKKTYTRVDADIPSQLA